MSGERVLVIDDSPTILKVVQLVLTKAGYEVRTAADGEAGVEAAREARPDVILLDFVMPRMNGYQVCRALADTDDLRDVPVVLMSAKGDQVGERFVKVMGIVDYITKPFSPEAITAVVGHTVAKYGRGDAGGSSGASLLAASAADLGVPLPAPEDVTAQRALDLAERRRDVAARLRTAILRALATDDLMGDELRARLTDGVLGAIVDEVGAFDAGAEGSGTQGGGGASGPAGGGGGAGRGRDGGVALEGDLATVPLGEVLGLLQQQQHSGALVVEREGARVTVYFLSGKVEFASAEGLGEEFLLGRYLVDLEVLRGDDLDELLAARARTGDGDGDGDGSGGGRAKLLGEQLLEAGLIAESELREALRRQTCERIYEVLRWRGGRFSFRTARDVAQAAAGATSLSAVHGGAHGGWSGAGGGAGGGGASGAGGPAAARAAAERAGLHLSVDAILMEGFRRVDEWHLIERAVDDFDAVFLRNEVAMPQLERARLSRDELAVLELVNGKATVKEIVRGSRMSTFDVSKMLYRLLSIKLVRRRVPPVAV